MNILIGCESSGTIRETFRAIGHDAYSCDLLPADDNSPHHMQGDVFATLEAMQWDMLIVHPPCTYICSSGLHWNKRDTTRQAKTEKAIQFVADLWAYTETIPYICLENPVGCINTRLPHMPKPQYIQPYQFGHDASKKTGLWLHNLPPLTPTKHIAPRIVTKNGKQYHRWANQTDSGQNRLPPSADRWKMRSKTYQGIASAMAEQWGNLPRNPNK